MQPGPNKPGSPDSSLPVTRPLSRSVVPAQAFLQDWMRSALILVEDWEALPASVREQMTAQSDRAQLLALLVEYKLLTAYQAARIGAGAAFGLVLGNYRILDRLGAGGMGVVYRAEHILLRRLVALKVLTLTGDWGATFISRFFTEMRAAAQIQHPNLVAAIDAGPIPGQEGEEPLGYYYVMEYVRGQNLEALVLERGPLPVSEACDLIYQVASALDVAHQQHLVHRDIKPSNVQVTPEGQAKLLDFGLARHYDRRLTEPGTALGTIDYIAPEQAQDASTVDGRADLYSLGGTLFWCLTGRMPFAHSDSALDALTDRLTQPPPSLRSLRPELPAGLDTVVGQMMAVDRQQRVPTARAVMQLLLPFLALQQRLLDTTADLKRSLTARENDLVHTRDALTLALATVAEERTRETGNHVLRLQRYCRRLAEEAAGMPVFARAIDAAFIETLACCAPLHDMAMVGLPDHVLQKPGRLNAEERVLMEAHTVMGASALQKVARRYGSAATFLQMAIAVVRHHHERYDGSGYPDRLVGSAIPLPARILRVADVYDSLRSRRSHRPAFSHSAAVNLMTESSPGQFDPGLLQAFQRCAPDFERIYRELPDGKKG